MSNKEPLFSAKNRRLITSPLSKDNPITIQVLGVCSALAVTAKLQPAVVMAISVTVVVALANVIISLIRNTIPNRIYYSSYYFHCNYRSNKAYVYEISKQPVFVGLIIQTVY